MQTIDDLKACLRTWLPDSIGLGVASVPEQAADPLDPTEAGGLHQARPARRRQFAAGRASARTALRAIGGPTPALPSDGDGGPVWPAGYLGSIAHTRAWAVAIVGATDHWQALGIDLEDWRRLQRPGLAQRILTPDELAAWRALLPTRQTRQLALIFSAKEALFKAWHPSLRQPLALRDVALRADPAPRLIWVRPDLPAPPPFQIHWDCLGSCCLATACVPAEQTG